MREEVAIIPSIQQQQKKNNKNKTFRGEENLRTLPLTSPTHGYL